MSGAIFAAATSVLLLLVTYALNQRSSTRLMRRQAQLDRINRQLGELYGPLLAVFLVSKISTASLRSKIRPGQDKYFRGAPSPLSEAEYARWRLWSEHVFGPGNRRARDLIYTKVDLLTDSEVPECLLAWCAHTQEYEVIFKQWEAGDLSEADATRDFSEFSNELEQYLWSTYTDLKRQQSRLIALTSARAEHPERTDTHSVPLGVASPPRWVRIIGPRH